MKSGNRGVGFFALFALCTNGYIIFKFHRSPGQNPSGGGLGPPPLKRQLKEREDSEVDDYKKAQQRDNDGESVRIEQYLRKKRLLKSYQQATGKNSEQRPMPKPVGWETFDFHQIRDHFDCHTYAHDQTKQLPTLNDWQFFKNRYRTVVDNAAVFDDPVPSTAGYTLAGGGPPPYFAAHSDGKGRALFASRDIKKGELVHDGNDSDIEFPSAMAWRKYVFSMPRNKACDMVDWTWTQQTEEGGGYKIFAAMNISVLMNTGGKNEININPESSTSSQIYAMRDIKKGEELVMDYTMYETAWEKVGLLSSADVGDDDDYDEDDSNEQPSETA